VTSDDHPSRSEHYRDIADSLGRLARQTRFPQVRQQLFDLAEGFDRIAELAEKRDKAERQP
jgi:hypothetical protein